MKLNTLCSHNEMIRSNPTTNTWKCAKCGFVYGDDNKLNDLLLHLEKLLSITEPLKEFMVKKDRIEYSRIAASAHEMRN